MVRSELFYKVVVLDGIKIVGKVYDNVPVFPIKLQYQLSTNDNVVYILGVEGLRRMNLV